MDHLALAQHQTACFHAPSWIVQPAGRPTFNDIYIKLCELSSVPPEGPISPLIESAPTSYADRSDVANSYQFTPEPQSGLAVEYHIAPTNYEMS